MMAEKRWQVATGDCFELLKTLADCSVDSIVTDPPYGLKFMGKAWDHSVPSVDVWRECLRVLKPGGHLLCFAGTRTHHRMACAIEDAGFEIRDMIAWVYGSGFPKSHDVSKAIDKAAGAERTMRVNERWADRYPNGPGGNLNSGSDNQQYGQLNRVSGNPLLTSDPATSAAQQWQGWGTALKPALEPITVARKPFTGTVAENVLEHGTGAINVDGCRVGHDEECRMMAPSQANIDNPSEKHRQAGRREAVLELKPSGRWPANLIHDGSEEVVGLLGEAARFFYCAKASKRDRDDGCEGLEEKHNKGSGTHGNGTAITRLGNATERAVGITHVELQKVRNNHPTVKPTDLMRYLCRLVTPPGGLVLDPFAGSGSTGRGATLEGLCFLGFELDPHYAEIARLRIGAVAKEVRQPELF